MLGNKKPSVTKKTGSLHTGVSHSKTNSATGKSKVPQEMIRYQQTKTLSLD